MASKSCLAGIDGDKIATLSAVLKTAGLSTLAAIASLNVSEIRQLAPEVIVCDIDNLEVDSLELLRQIRFVLPTAIVVVYTAKADRAWGVECHIAGANGVLSQSSTASELAAGVHGAIATGCYTDPRFAAA